MSLFSDPSLLGSVTFAGLVLCWLAVGWRWASEAWVAGLGTRSTALTAPPTRLGAYVLAGRIGEGAMGEVYRARHSALGVWRAVKVLRRGASERDRQLFEKEAQLGAELQHPNAARIYEQSEAPDGTRYFAMELVEGVTLSELVNRQGPQAPELVVQILLQLCAALEHAHGRGLVHRDIKPDNVLVSGGGQAKLIDFGLVERVGQMKRGESDMVVGTPLYISPEAILAPETVDARSDLYGLGAVAYFLLTRAPVFRGRSVAEVCGHHLHTAPERPSLLLGGDIPGELEQIILDCLAKDPAQRPVSAAALARRLRHCLRAQRAFTRLDAGASREAYQGAA